MKWLSPAIEAEGLTATGRHRPRLGIAVFIAAAATVGFDGGMDLIVDNGIFLVARRRE